MSFSKGQRARLNRRLELQSTAKIQRIRESFRASAVSTRCALLEPSIRSYGSPRTRRKLDVEEDHVIALQTMTPYPQSKMDLLDDLEDIHTNIPLSNSTTSLAARVSLDRQPSRAWGTSVFALRETTSGGRGRRSSSSSSSSSHLFPTNEEIKRQEQNEIDQMAATSKTAPEQQRIEYSAFTQSLIERTHSRLYDEPKYVQMTKRVMGYHDDERTNKVLANMSKMEEKYSDSLGGLSLHDLGQHNSSFDPFESQRDYFDIERELPYLDDNEEEDEEEEEEKEEKEKDLNDRERFNDDRVQQQHKTWTKGVPTVFVTGTLISTDGAYNRNDEPRVSHHERLGMTMKTNDNSGAKASSFRQRAKHLEQSVVGIVAPSSPGVVHKHMKLPLRMGAPSLDGHERQPQHDSNSVMSEGKQNQWELSSFAHAHTFRDSLKSPMKRADSTKRVSFMHRSNMSSLPMSIL